MQIVKEVSHMRKQACLMIQQRQEQMIAQDPKKEKWFKVGEEVLCWDFAYKTHYSEKLKSKWKGPYVIAIILLNRAYKIADQRGVLRIPINEDQLKLYNRQFLEPIVIIIDKPQKLI